SPSGLAPFFAKSLRMNTYEKTGEGGPPINDPLSHSCLPLVPSTRGARFLAPRALFERCHVRPTHPSLPAHSPLAYISVPDFSMTENCRLRIDDSSSMVYLARLLREAAGRFLP